MKIRRILAVFLAFNMIQYSVSAAELDSLTNIISKTDLHLNYDSKLETKDIKDDEVVDETSDRYIIKCSSSQTSLLSEKIESKIDVDEVYIDEMQDKSSDNIESDKNNIINVVHLSEAVDVNEFTSNMLGDDALDIKFIQPDYKVRISTVDNIANNVINITKKYDDLVENDDRNVEVKSESTNSDDEIIVAIIDTGVDITHSELTNYLWHNDYELENNNDDDLNGYIDDAIGWDFVEKKQLEYDSSLAVDYTHGTHVAGIISDFNNECGDENIKILPLRAFTNGSAYTSDIIEAIKYAEKMGARIVNCSFGSFDENIALKEAIENSNMLFICAAGNNRLNIADNPIYPACFGLDNVISVAATSDRDYISYFSNYGNMIDISADGCSIESTVPDNQVGYSSGTSMAAAYISKAVALIEAKGTTSNSDVKELLFNTADHISSLEGKICDMRKVNISNILNNITNDKVIINDKEDYSIDTTTSNIMNKDFSLYGLENANIDAISAGGYHSTVLIDGNVYAFGDDHYCQVSGLVYAGEGDIPAPGFCDIYSVKKISTRGDHTLALMQDGTVRAWGRNDYGQLGDGTVNEYITDGYYLAEQVYGLSNIVDIAAGHDFSLALDSQGRVYAWGNNKGGKLGVGSSYEAYLTPVQISTLSGIKQISAGHYHALALSKSGTVYGWGNNSNGEFGKSTYSNYESPTVIDISDVKKVVAGFNNSFFIKTDGTTYGCGQNSDGQLGDGSMEEKKTIIKIPIEGVTDISSTGTTIFLKDNGEVYGCGLNVYGQLGQGNTSYRYTSLVKIPGEYSQISEGGNHTLLLSTDGLLYSMGRNHKLQCGFGEKYEIITAPKLVDAFSESALTIDNITVDYQTNKVVLTGEFNIPDNRRNWYVKYTDKTNRVRNESVSMLIEDETYTAKFTPRFAVDGATQAKLYCDGYGSYDDNEYEFDFEFTYLVHNVENKTNIAYLPTDDTYVSQHSEDYNTNFNDNQLLSVNYTRRQGGTDLWGRYSLLRFNIDNVDKAHLLSAKLRVYVDESSDVRNSNRTVSIYNITNEWDASQITWATNNIEIESEPIGQFDVAGTGWAIQNPGWREIDITKFIYNIDESEISLFAKMTSTDAHPINIRSSEHNIEETRPELVIEYSLRENMYDNYVQVFGQTEANKDLLVRVFNPKNSIETLEQLHSDIHGHYYYSHHTSWPNKGTYQTIVSTEGKAKVDYFITDIYEKTDIEKIIIDEPEVLEKPQGTLQVSLSDSDGKSYVIVNGTLINNEASDKQNNMVFTGVYDKKNKLVEYSTMSSSTIGDEPFVIRNQIELPTDLSEFNVKVFVCEGDNLYSGSMALLQEPYKLSSASVSTTYSSARISRYLPSLSDESMLSSVTPIDISNLSPIIRHHMKVMSVPLLTNADGLDVDISITNNGKNTERILKKDNYFCVKYDIKNKTTEAKDITPILAFFRNGQTSNIKLGYGTVSLEPGGKKTISMGFSLVNSDLTTDSAKIMLWNNFTGIRPYIAPITLSKDNEDFYGDEYNTASPITLMSGLEGKIDSETDIDIVKFTPNITETYKFMCNTSDDLEVIITDSNLQEIVSRDLSDGDTLTVELEKGTEYYLKITADNQKECNYSFNILPLDVEGYKPINISEWGVYTINACEGNVYLYNYNYDLIAEGNSQHQISGVELNEGTYYVSVDGTNNPNVQITKEVSPTLKLGSGVSGIYPGALKSIYYSFEPDVSGWYVFSATGNCSMNGVLYSDSHLEISASNSNNYNGNFAMKQYLNAGETYYLKIESKYNSSGDYAIHVEKPLEILSIYEGNEL